MKTITFGIQKGGTGKTSISMAVASQFAIEGHKTLFIDADPQGNASGWILKSLDYELADTLNGNCDVNNAIQDTTIENLKIIPTAGLGGDLRLYGETLATQKPYAIRQMISKIAGLGFEYVIIDTSPAFSPLEKQCYLASDEVIPVLQLDIFSSDGLEVFTNLIKTLREDFGTEKPFIDSIVLNAKDDRLPQQKTLLDQYKTMNMKLFTIPVDQGFKRSQGAGFFIQEFANTKKETLEALKLLADSLKE